MSLSHKFITADSLTLTSPEQVVLLQRIYHCNSSTKFRCPCTTGREVFTKWKWHPRNREIKDALWPWCHALFSTDWKFLPLIYADEGAYLYPEGMCSTAFLGGAGFTQIWTHLALSPLCLSDGSQRSGWGTRSPACRAGPVALFHPELTRQHEQYRNELNHPSKLCHGIEQRFPTFLTRRHTVTMIQHNDNTIIVIQSKQTRFFVSNPGAPATPGLAWTPSVWRASILCHLLGSSGESKWLGQSGTRSRGLYS